MCFADFMCVSTLVSWIIYKISKVMKDSYHIDGDNIHKCQVWMTVEELEFESREYVSNRAV